MTKSIIFIYSKSIKGSVIMNFRIQVIIVLLASTFSCKTSKVGLLYESSNLKVERLTTNTFRHISYLATNDFGKVSCNGMIVIDAGEALIFDTPTNDADSKELIDWVERTLECSVVGVVITHFHDDCLGGINEFHKRNIPSYASFKTIELAESNGISEPKLGFDDYLEVRVGHKKVVNEFLGEGHTADNIVSYFPDEKVLFGGCLIKTLGASKGYLGDANTKEWSKTVLAVKSKYNQAQVIIPGHGQVGDTELLDYTITLFDD